MQPRARRFLPRESAVLAWCYRQGFTITRGDQERPLTPSLSPSDGARVSIARRQRAKAPVVKLRLQQHVSATARAMTVLFKAEHGEARRTGWQGGRTAPSAPRSAAQSGRSARYGAGGDIVAQYPHHNECN